MIPSVLNLVLLSSDGLYYFISLIQPFLYMGLSNLLPNFVCLVWFLLSSAWQGCTEAYVLGYLHPAILYHLWVLGTLLVTWLVISETGLLSTGSEEHKDWLAIFRTLWLPPVKHVPAQSLSSFYCYFHHHYFPLDSRSTSSAVLFFSWMCIFPFNHFTTSKPEACPTECKVALFRDPQQFGQTINIVTI